MGNYAAKVSKVGKESLSNAFAPAKPDFDSRAKFTSRVLVLKNMVKITDLENEEDYQELHEDIMDEVKQHGRVISIVIPRPRLNTSGIGRIFVEYAHVEDAVKAKDKLDGRRFRDKRVECGYHPEELFFASNFKGD